VAQATCTLYYGAETQHIPPLATAQRRDFGMCRDSGRRRR